jgi:ligand-binding sensor domain-containing protein
MFFFFVVAAVLMHGIGVTAAPLSGRTFTSANRAIAGLVVDDHYLWGVTGGDGVVRIDKASGESSIYSFATGRLISNSAMSIAKGNDGAIIVGTSFGGIERFDGAKWERLAGLSDSGIWKMAIDGQGKVWAWTQHSGIVRLDAGASQAIVSPFSGALKADPAGNMWIMNLPVSEDSGCDRAWIRKYANGALLSSVSLTQLCPQSSYSQSLVIDSKENCWIGTLDKLIKVSGQTVRAFSANSAADTRVYCTVLAVDNDDALLFMTQTYVSGLFASTRLFIHDTKNAAAGPFDSAVETFTDRYIHASACADVGEKCFWVALSNGSIIKIDSSRRVTPLSGANAVLPSNSIAAILIDKADNVWAATSGGATRRSDTLWTLYRSPGDSFPGNNVRCLAQDSSGTVWAGFWQPMASEMASTGISCFENGRWRMLFRSYFSQKAMSVDKNGDVWVVAENGVFRYHGGVSEMVYGPSPSRGFDTTINAVAVDAGGKPWIGTDFGLKRYDGAVWTDDSAFGRLAMRSTDTGPLPAVEVGALCFYGNTAWIGTDRGLFKRVGNDCTRFDTAAGVLPDSYVQCIASDGPTSAWVGTRRGLARINGQDHATYTPQNTPLCDGDITACAVARNGDLWVGTRRGGLTVLRGAAKTAVAEKPRAFPRGVQSAEISSSIMHGVCRISIRIQSPAVIGFSVISLKGEMIKRFVAAQSDGLVAHFAWDGKDRMNRSVSQGVFLGIATADGKVIGHKILKK